MSDYNPIYDLLILGIPVLTIGASVVAAHFISPVGAEDEQ